MTAYNRINGTYCANSSELCTDILRAEWGFDGVVMTDWLSTGEDRADEGLAFEAGVSLIMPGGRKTAGRISEKAQRSQHTAESLKLQCGRVLLLVLDEQEKG